MINLFSMRTFVPTTEESGHDHFFASFDHFQAVEDPSHLGEWVDEVATRAATQNEQYLEIMHTPNFRPALAGRELGPVDAQLISPTTPAVARRRLRKIFAGDYAPSSTNATASAASWSTAAQAAATPACSVQVRFLYQVLRALPPARSLSNYSAVSSWPRPPTGRRHQHGAAGRRRVAMANYRAQMLMVHALHILYPKVHITLHAGELGPGMVPPDDLRFHIRSAVEEAGAERIGHGVDVMYEARPYDLLKEMASKRVMAEINLTSNDVILNIKGADHPLPMYRLYHVPVALSTDDEGSRAST